jgi:hypothetical protein
VTINDIFEEYSDITIEIKIKKSGNYFNDDLPNISPNVYSYCQKHTSEFGKFYCETCKTSICFLCTLLKNHKNHNFIEKTSLFERKFYSINEKYLTVKSSILEENFIENFRDHKEKYAQKIEEDFTNIINRALDIKTFYIKFYEDFFNQLQEKFKFIISEFNKIDKNFNELKNNLSLKTEIYSLKLEDFVFLENQINLYLKNYKRFLDLTKMNNEFDNEYKNNLSSILHRLEIIKSDYFNENRLKKYSELCQIGIEDMLLKKNLSHFAEYFSTSPTSYNEIVSLPIPLTKNVLTYNHKNELFKIYTVGEKDYSFKFFDFSRYLNLGNYIFVCGGLEKNIEVSLTYLCSINSCQVFPSANLNRGKSQHSLVLSSFNNLKLIFAVSGYNNPDVEVFDVLKNEWSYFKSLSRPRCNANVLFVDGGKFMFIFGGSEGDKYLSNHFERINLSEFYSYYTNCLKNNLSNYIFSFEQGSFTVASTPGIFLKETNLNYSGYGIVPLAENQFLVCGGFNIESESPSTNEIRHFEFDNNSLTFIIKISYDNLKNRSNTLPCYSCFYYQDFLIINENLLAQFDASGTLLQYNQNTNSFNAIPHNLNI